MFFSFLLIGFPLSGKSILFQSRIFRITFLSNKLNDSSMVNPRFPPVQKRGVGSLDILTIAQDWEKILFLSFRTGSGFCFAC